MTTPSKSDREAAEFYEANLSQHRHTASKAFLAGIAHERLRAKVLVDVVESVLKSCGSLHKPIYFIHLREALKTYQSQTDGESVE